jgi:DNA-directed RNA polymerase specialized sigma24 family protein
MRTTGPGDAGTTRFRLARPDAEYRTLMARYQAGDAEAFEALYDRLAGDLETYLRRLAPDGLRKAVIDDVFLSIHRARATYDPRLMFEPWIAAIASHVAGGRGRAQGASWWRRCSVGPERADRIQPRDALRRQAAGERGTH